MITPPWLRFGAVLVVLGVACAGAGAPPAPPPVPAAPAPPPAPLAPPVAPPSPSARVEDEENTIAVFRAAAPATVHVTQNQLVRDRRTLQAIEVPAGAGT